MEILFFISSRPKEARLKLVQQSGKTVAATDTNTHRQFFLIITKILRALQLYFFSRCCYWTSRKKKSRQQWSFCRKVLLIHGDETAAAATRKNGFSDSVRNAAKIIFVKTGASIQFSRFTLLTRKVMINFIR